MKLFDLTGRAAVVTGGNGGIGLGMARGLAEAGAAIMVAGRNAEKSAEAVAELEALGAKAAQTEVDQFGRLDILINNAGINIRKRPEEYEIDEWRQVIETNLTSAFVCSQAAYPHFKAAGGGKIISIGSMYSIFGAPMTNAYGASKGGLVQMTKGLATAWARENIQVNTVLPGWIDTDLTRRARQDIPELHDRVLQRTPTGRWGVPEDHAGVAVFLASAASDFVTGTSIPVDGGYGING
jgi:2-deoxy-D-gluconate 3-dehydrogenase